MRDGEKKALIFSEMEVQKLNVSCFLGISFGFSGGQIGRKRPLKMIKAVVSVVLDPENMQHNKSWVC